MKRQKTSINCTVDFFGNTHFAKYTVIVSIMAAFLLGEATVNATDYTCEKAYTKNVR